MQFAYYSRIYFSSDMPDSPQLAIPCREMLNVPVEDIFWFNLGLAEQCFS
jgi:hypothetical protein